MFAVTASKFSNVRDSQAETRFSGVTSFTPPLALVSPPWESATPQTSFYAASCSIASLKYS